jgi:hypothetical protein
MMEYRIDIPEQIAPKHQLAIGQVAEVINNILENLHGEYLKKEAGIQPFSARK